MMKLFEKPKIHFTQITPGDDVSEDDDVSGQSTTDYCIDYENWIVSFGLELGDTSEEAYKQWLKDNADHLEADGCAYLIPED